MRTSEFTNFLRLAEEGKPVFREALTAANKMVKDEIQDHVSNAETATSHP